MIIHLKRKKQVSIFKPLSRKLKSDGKLADFLNKNGFVVLMSDLLCGCNRFSKRIAKTRESKFANVHLTGFSQMLRMQFTPTFQTFIRYPIHFRLPRPILVLSYLRKNVPVRPDLQINSVPHVGSFHVDPPILARPPTSILIPNNVNPAHCPIAVRIWSAPHGLSHTYSVQGVPRLRILTKGQNLPLSGQHIWASQGDRGTR